MWLEICKENGVQKLVKFVIFIPLFLSIGISAQPFYGWHTPYGGNPWDHSDDRDGEQRPEVRKASISEAPAAESFDVFVPICKYIAKGDAEALSAWFADNLEIGILSKESTASRQQAKQIVRSFFENYTPRSFDITHTAGHGTMKYALGNLKAGGENFLVTIFVSFSGRPRMNPFGNPYAAPGGNPYAAFGNPYAAPYGNPYAVPGGRPSAGPDGNASADNGNSQEREAQGRTGQRRYGQGRGDRSNAQNSEAPANGGFGFRIQQFIIERQ